MCNCDPNSLMERDPSWDRVRASKFKQEGTATNYTFAAGGPEEMRRGRSSINTATYTYCDHQNHE